MTILCCVSDVRVCSKESNLLWFKAYRCHHKCQSKNHKFIYESKKSKIIVLQIRLCNISARPVFEGIVQLCHYFYYVLFTQNLNGTGPLPILRLSFHTTVGLGARTGHIEITIHCNCKGTRKCTEMAW